MPNKQQTTDTDSTNSHIHTHTRKYICTQLSNIIKTIECVCIIVRMYVRKCHYFYMYSIKHEHYLLKVHEVKQQLKMMTNLKNHSCGNKNSITA